MSALGGAGPKTWRIRGGQEALRRVTEPPADKGWYRILNAATARAEVSVYGDVGEWGVTSADFSRDLAAVTAPAIDLRINSRGGEVWEGLAIYNAIRRHPAQVTSHVDAAALSIASVIAQAGDTRLIAPQGSLMVHNASGVCVGEHRDMRSTAELLEQLTGQIADVYAERSGGTVAQWRTAMDAETWYTAGQAVTAGLADRVEHHAAAASARQTTAQFDPARFRQAVTAGLRAAPADDTGSRIAAAVRRAIASGPVR